MYTGVLIWMTLFIIFLLISVAYSSAECKNSITDVKNPQISDLPNPFEKLFDECGAANSLFELYSIFMETTLYYETRANCRIKLTVVKKFLALHASMDLAETLKDLIIRNNHGYVHFYCWVLMNPMDISTHCSFESSLQTFVIIERYFKAQIEDLYLERMPFDFHTVRLLIKIVRQFSMNTFGGDLARFCEKNLKPPKFLNNLQKKDPYAQFEEIIRNFVLKGVESKIQAQEGFFAFRYFAKTIFFIQKGQNINWNFVISLSPRWLLALFYVHLQEDACECSVALLFDILTSKFINKSALLDRFRVDFLQFYNHMLDTMPGDVENILRIGHKLSGSFRIQKHLEGENFLIEGHEAVTRK
jgi:hypothetical protein